MLVNRHFSFTFKLIFASLLIVLFSSCYRSSGRVIFSEKLYHDAALNDNNIKDVQFYIDREIVLYRVVSKTNAGVSEGRITMRGGEQVEEIVIEKGTKGTVVFLPKSDRLGVSFDSKSADRYLMFGPNPNKRNQYTLLGTEWDKSKGVVTYDGQKWTTPAYSANATLLVNLNDETHTKVKSESPGGRTVK